MINEIKQFLSAYSDIDENGRANWAMRCEMYIRDCEDGVVSEREMLVCLDDYFDKFSEEIQDWINRKYFELV